MRHVTIVLLGALFLAACGGGGGGGSSAPLPGDRTLYVSPTGNDDNDGLAADRALRTIARAASLLAPGDTVYVAPGTYTLLPTPPGEPRPTEAVNIDEVVGTAARPVRLIADIFGAQTGAPAGDVVINTDDASIGIRVSRSSHIVLDGFRIIGARGNNGAGVQVRSNSSDVTVRNCIITRSGDGIRVENSNDALLFNNLIYGNDNRGVRISNGAQRARIINNTIVNNRNRGIAIGGANANNVAATGATVRNNIVQNNNNVSISIETGPPTSLEGYSGNFNLVFYAELADQTKTYRPTTIVGAQDVNADAVFIDEEAGDFHLDPAASPAIDAGTGAIGDVLVSQLFDRTTVPGGEPDDPPVDLGYHYPVP